MTYHVSIYGDDCNSGTINAPFRTINHAAQIAQAGDTVQVHDGTYREWVNPKNGGLSEDRRIVYEAAPCEHPIIKGSEIVTDWERVEGTVWKKTLPNTLFGAWNPYFEELSGDWFQTPATYPVHHGDVYVNGRSMYEASSMEDLYEAKIRYMGWQRSRLPDVEPIRDPEYTIYRWISTVDDENTTIYCNFHQLDPNEEIIEINVRKCCFYPTQSGLNYITVRGFEMAHAACPFAPPTSNQIGMLGVNWSYGWVIENNHLHDAKCNAISIGTNETTGDNESQKTFRKHSHHYQTEAIFLGLQNGWQKGVVGSHLIRNNEIHDCGQTAIVGHMGGAFSRIEHNHIYNISVKHEFHGSEIGGIKLHAPIDVEIIGNNIHDCTRGMWLDWQAQGTRVTKNVFYKNDRCDLMIEVTHGPCLIDNNIFLSEKNFENLAQGTAFVHNIIAGNSVHWQVLDRETPYHFPHSTQIKGITKVFGGDDRVLNNIILGAYIVESKDFTVMSSGIYNCYQTPERYYEKTISMRRRSTDEILPTPQPVWIDGNAYAGTASAFRAERNTIRVDGMTATINKRDETWILTLNVPESFNTLICEKITEERLGSPIFTEQPYENPDGTPIDFTEDFSECHRNDSVIPGPFASLSPGNHEICVWKK